MAGYYRPELELGRKKAPEVGSSGACMRRGASSVQAGLAWTVRAGARATGTRTARTARTAENTRFQETYQDQDPNYSNYYNYDCITLLIAETVIHG